MSYAPPLDDLAFLLHRVFEVARSGIPGYAELDPDTTAAILSEAGRLATERLAPVSRAGDLEGCRFENGVVRVPEGFKAAYDAVRAGGWTALDLDPDYGGQGMPTLMNSITGEMFVAANMALDMYWGLTHGAYNAIHAHGTAEQKATYLPKFASGEWTGTMNLTEPQCGTDLGLLRTRAEPRGDGTYSVSGQKIFISSGEHDLAENIIHLVLARIPGGPPGVKGLSLLIVPKFLPTPEGTLGARNGVSCGAIERKMGIHGNPTCVMNYDGATGFLIGEPHRGLRAMFTMMNEARLAVAAQGLAQGAAALAQASAYARDRRQGRALPAPAEPGAPADPLIVHPDIRRALMDMRAFVEGGRALMIWDAMFLDRARAGDAEAEGLAALLTPVLKGFLTDRGFAATVEAQQVFGGHGYIEDWPMSQLVRDARITMIYEGTNGIQALDLVGRKLAQDGGAPMRAFLAIVKDFLREAEAGTDAEFKATFLDPLAAAIGDLEAAVLTFLRVGMTNPNAALAGSTDFLHLLGLVCLGLMWARMARAADGDTAFDRAKRLTARHYMTRLLPETALRRARIEADPEPLLTLPAEAF
ncbi:acyl-CoA dehydrogenase [Amaricoccus solimangrovi]|uniref:3-methylmercaptopropionyl-CoA dehydrogenase n=1 Tax=Amaricoccus solimangrovi TaxID=2589815 RepID=A0A501WVL0_9RHOB|nr:acyl-CoA dehydrogenase [Amaricoccus solimangrovi]TPE52164.1 acyl-CoA dehydrogenase [Amaricoccus solimangrovi]